MRKYTKTQIKNIAEHILKLYCDECPTNIFHIAKQLDLKIYEAIFDRDDVSGMIEARNKKIYIAKQDSEQRQRFSIAHEIGHYVLHHSGNIDYEQYEHKHISFRDNAASLGFDIREIEANFFAANLLMPESRIKELFTEGFSLQELAYYMNVSKAAMTYRLEYLGLFDA